MKHFRIDVLVESDRDEKQLAMFIEGVLAAQKWHFQIKDLSVYEVCQLSAHTQRARGE